MSKPSAIEAVLLMLRHPNDCPFVRQLPEDEKRKAIIVMQKMADDLETETIAEGSE